ncbi:hypothetical protein BGZ49_000242 [Haplosporangium sp. Z 27]|nr:hypothetical protein BGZ49_000242 [Haplosporangium sp. Z 27]
MDQYYLKQEQPSEKQQLKCLKEQYQNQYSPNCSTRSTSPVLSSYSQDSSSPAQAMDCGRDLSYWSPPTPNLSIDHHQSNHPNTRTATNANATSASSASVVGVVNQEGVKSYPCPTCNKAFPTRTQLKSHMAIHVDNFPFPCMYSGCDLHFKRKHDLRRHVDAKHALVKKYLCASGCGEGFGRRDQMIRHLRKGSCASFQSDHKM